MLGLRSLGAEIPQLSCLGPLGDYWGWAGCLNQKDVCALYLVA
jgi:hypothetical protein